MVIISYFAPIYSLPEIDVGYFTNAPFAGTNGAIAGTNGLNQVAEFIRTNVGKRSFCFV
jgi:hypothetical protein